MALARSLRKLQSFFTVACAGSGCHGQKLVSDFGQRAHDYHRLFMKTLAHDGRDAIDGLRVLYGGAAKFHDDHRTSPEIASKDNPPPRRNTETRRRPRRSWFRYVLDQLMYPCALSNSPFSRAAPAAPRIVLCESTVNFQSKILQGRRRPTTALMPRPRSRSNRGCGRSGAVS